MEDTEIFDVTPRTDVLIAIFAVRKHLILLLFRNVCLPNSILSSEETGKNPELISYRRRILVGLDDKLPHNAKIASPL